MFSVVIPLYNKELSIKNTIQSVLEQSFQDFEIIIVNDGSNDNSAQIVETINDTRIHLIHQQNQGVSTARNRGIQEARYDWIAFLDADDLWTKEHLQEIITMMQKFPEEKVFVTSFDYSDKRLMFKYPRDEPIFKIKNYFQEAMKEQLICTNIVVVHKNSIKKIGGFNEKLNRGEDLDLWARLARKFPIIKSQKATAIYNIDDLNSLSKGKSEYKNSILSIIDLKGIVSHERKYFKKILYLRLKENIKTLDISETFKILKKHNIQLIR